MNDDAPEGDPRCDEDERCEEVERAARDAAQRERVRLARVLHDDVGPEVTAAMYLCAALHHELSARGDAHASRVARLSELLEGAAERLQALIQETKHGDRQATAVSCEERDSEPD